MMAAEPRSAGTRFGRVLGVGGYRPRRLVTNEEIAARIGRTPDWIRSRSGIRTRHFADRSETIAVMGAAAAEKALAAAGVDARRVGSVILATTTNLVNVPPASVEIAHRIGATGAATIDLSAACAGFCYGLALADHAIRADSAEYVLVVGAERLTDLVDADDDQIAFLLADGAGAALVGPADRPSIGPVVWGADGTQFDAVQMTRSWGALRDDPTLAPPVMRMHGKPVFRWVIAEMVPVARRALAAAGLRVEDLDAFIPHQANQRITDLLAAQLELPATVAVADDIVEAGNTSSASIPLAMERLCATGRAEAGGQALLVGFGAGLTYAALTVTLP